MKCALLLSLCAFVPLIAASETEGDDANKLEVSQTSGNASDISTTNGTEFDESSSRVNMSIILEGNGNATEDFHKNASSIDNELQIQQVESDSNYSSLISQFPPLINLSKIPPLGSAAIALLITAYLAVAVIILCDDYYIPAVERICQTMRMKTDVVGATLVAFGISLPQLCVSLSAIALKTDKVFFSDVEALVSTSVFNLLLVLCLCSILAGKVINLSWWPTIRDSCFYSATLMALLVVIYDGIVTWYEALITVFLYLVYLGLLFFNSYIESYMMSRVPPKHDGKANYKMLTSEQAKLTDPVHSGSESDDERDSGKTKRGNNPVRGPAKRAKMEIDRANSHLDEPEMSHFSCPRSNIRRCCWFPFLPVYFIFLITVPDCRKLRWRNKSGLTYFMSILWISGLCYVITWLITFTGFVMKIPDTIQTLTLGSAASCFVGTVACVLIIRDGFGDMVMSGIFGSNIFRTLLCMGLPLLLQILLTHSENITEQLKLTDLIYMSVTMLVALMLTLSTIIINSWRLNRCTGSFLFVFYVIFLVLASLYQLGYFELIARGSQ